MDRKPILVSLLAGLLLAACSRPIQTAPAPPPSAPPEPPKAGSQAAAAALERIRLQPGEVLPGVGIYFLNTTEGSVEGWQPRFEPRNLRFQVSDDNRFVGVTADEGLFLIDRQKGSVAAAAGIMLDSRGGRILLVEPLGNLQASGRYLVLDTEQRVVSRFELPQSGRESRALISPDGAKAYITTYDVQGGRGYLYLADLAAGEAVLVNQGSDEGREVLSGSLTAIGGTAELLWTLTTHRAQSRGEAGFSTLVMRLDWQGKVMMERVADGYLAGLSPDGRYALWQRDIAGYPGAVVLSDLGGRAFFRARLFTLEAAWLSDSSAFLVNDRGSYKQIALTGAVQPFAPCETVRCLDGVTPAPDDPDRFLIGRLQVIHANGKPDHLARLGSEQLRTQYVKPWGESSTELRIAVETVRGGGGWDGFAWALPLTIERPPFDDRLVVKGTGDCLNLRERPELGATVRGCLPDGTPLTVARSNDQESSLLWGDGGQWVYVKTEGGQEGWASIGSGFVSWLH